MGNRQAVNSRRLIHPTLGKIEIVMRSDAVRYTARWKEDVLRLTVPPSATGETVMKIIAEMEPKLLKKRPILIYNPGDRIELPEGFSVGFSRQGVKPRNVMASLHGQLISIEVGRELDMASPEVTSAVSRILCRIASRLAPELLLPRAMELARQVGASPASWSIMSGFHTLGKCSSRRVIHLSYVNVFLPPELRDYIVFHELAHLSEMSHSPRFHAICDRYCSGREKEFVKQLRDYRWPILRR